MIGIRRSEALALGLLFSLCLTAACRADDNAPMVGDVYMPVMHAGSNVSFLASDFNASFFDVDVGDELSRVKITSLPDHGALTLLGEPVQAGDDASCLNLQRPTTPRVSGCRSR